MTEIPQPDRLEQATQLVEDFNLNEDAEFFSDTAHRTEFLQSLDFDTFMDIAQHVNARMRGFEPRENLTKGERGASLPLLRTPEGEEKHEALEKGFDVIQRYLQESTDDDDQKLRGTSMAVEALIVWAHPFADGNGRTSRFLGKFIADGTTDTEQLIQETVDRNERSRLYDERIRVDQALDYEKMDIILDDDEIEEMRRKQEELPIVEGIALSIERLLHDKTVQDGIEAETSRNLEVRQTALARRDAA